MHRLKTSQNVAKKMRIHDKKLLFFFKYLNIHIYRISLLLNLIIS